MAGTRERLLEAAREVVADAGAQHLTLEAVADRAGVSKGGLLYHFPSKEALLAAMVTELMDDFEARRQRALCELGADPAAALKAYVIANDSDSARERQLAQGLAASLVNQPELLAPVCSSMREHVDQAVRDAADPALAMLICLASDGQYVIEALGLLRLSPEERAAVRKRLLRLAEQSRATPPGTTT